MNGGLRFAFTLGFPGNKEQQPIWSVYLYVALALRHCDWYSYFQCDNTFLSSFNRKKLELLFMFKKPRCISLMVCFVDTSSYVVFHLHKFASKLPSSFLVDSVSLGSW